MVALIREAKDLADFPLPKLNYVHYRKTFRLANLLLDMTTHQHHPLITHSWTRTSNLFLNFTSDLGSLIVGVYRIQLFPRLFGAHREYDSTVEQYTSDK